MLVPVTYHRVSTPQRLKVLPARHWPGKQPSRVKWTSVACTGGGEAVELGFKLYLKQRKLLLKNTLINSTIKDYIY